MIEKSITIEGMTCPHCVARVEKSLKELDGVVEAKVDLASKTAKLKFWEDVDDALIRTAVDDAGYQVTEIFVE